MPNRKAARTLVSMIRFILLSVAVGVSRGEDAGVLSTKGLLYTARLATASTDSIDLRDETSERTKNRLVGSRSRPTRRLISRASWITRRRRRRGTRRSS